jgi:hypothetical protein
MRLLRVPAIERCGRASTAQYGTGLAGYRCLTEEHISPIASPKTGGGRRRSYPQRGVSSKSISRAVLAANS